MSADADQDLEKKHESLLAALKNSEEALLAYSGGVDSTFLMRMMSLSGMKFIAATGISDTMPEADHRQALALAKEEGVEHLMVSTDELLSDAFIRNSPERCFHCKDELFGKLRSIATERGIRSIFDGTNADDLKDYRPGRKAAELHGVRSPLAEYGFSKDEIRRASRKLGLSTWDQPSSPCLSSRFPYGRMITIDSLRRVEAAEAFLKTFGLSEVRVRDHGDTARIEVPCSDMHLLLAPLHRSLITEKLRSLGYTFISMDLEGFRSGSLNRVLELSRP